MFCVSRMALSGSVTLTRMGTGSSSAGSIAVSVAASGSGTGGRSEDRFDGTDDADIAGTSAEITLEFLTDAGFVRIR